MKTRILGFCIGLIFNFNLVFGQTVNTWTLQSCVETALANNITMKQSQLTVESNKVSVNQAKMNRYPNLNAGASQSLNFGRSVNPYDNTVVANQQVNSSNLSLSSNVNLFSGFQNELTIQQRQLNLKASQEDIGTTKNNIVLGVVEAFANVLSNKALLSSSKAQFQSTEAQIDRTDKLVKAGRLAITNFYDMKAQLATEETNIILAENNLEISRLTLAQWMQIDPTQITDVVEPSLVIDQQEDKSAKEVYAVAESNQPQITAAKTRLLSAEKGISVAKSGFYPSLSFQAGLFTNYSSLAQKFISGQTLGTPILVPVNTFALRDATGNIVPFTVNQVVTSSPGTFQDLNFNDQFDNNLRKGFTFNLNIPLFNAFQNKYLTQNAKISKLNAQLQLDQQKNQLRQTIESAVTNEKAARKRVEAVEKQLLALEEAYRSTEQRFNLGVLNTVDFLVSKNNLTRAQNDKLRFRYDFFIRRALLDFYLGKDLKFN